MIRLSTPMSALYGFQKEKSERNSQETVGMGRRLTCLGQRTLRGKNSLEGLITYYNHKTLFNQ